VDNPWLETDVVMISTKAGSTVRLSAAGTDAGDDAQNVKVTWWIYREVGTIEGATSSQINGLNTEVMLPPVKSPGTVPVILQTVAEKRMALFFGPKKRPKRLGCPDFSSYSPAPEQIVVVRLTVSAGSIGGVGGICAGGKQA
jgi:hypothetical protein